MSASTKRSHVYVTNVYDLIAKRLVWSGERCSEATVQTFFDFLSRGRITKLDGVCCDMWQPYIDTIKEKVPRVALVFDKFHIVRRLMDAVDQARCDEMREKGPAHKQLMARSRYVWLKNPWNLTDKQDI